MADLLPQKRPRSPDAHEGQAPTFPTGDLTVDRVDEFLALTDREKICWALQTETRVRLAKVENRECFKVSTTLTEGNFLFDVYPKNIDETTVRQAQFQRELKKVEDHNQKMRDLKGKMEEAASQGNYVRAGKFQVKLKAEAEGGGVVKGKNWIIEKDRIDYQCKSRSFLQKARDPDESWSSLTPLEVTGYEQHDNALRSHVHVIADMDMDMEPPGEYDLAPVPPNMLFFRIIMEGYMGYRWPGFHSSSSDFPRCAVMGGAVLAVLTAWRKEEIVKDFQYMHLPSSFDHEEQYLRKRASLVRTVNDYFIYSEKYAIFSDGDVDVFLQASPMTRNLMQYFDSQRMASIIETISEYIGGLGFVQRDLRFMSKIVADETSNILDFSTAHTNLTSFIYALAHNGLSFQLAAHENDFKNSLWPRTTQMIQLKPQADLLGGLLDFDISAVSCAYDGNGVHVTPRASMSLVTLTQVVTPFVLNEDRNRSRIIKYWKRGFVPYLVDPNCFHSSQCNVGGNVLILERGVPIFRDGETEESNTRSKAYPPFKARDLQGDRPSRPAMQDVYQFQREELAGVFCCGPPWHKHGDSSKFSFALFEQEEGDAMRFFAECNNWTREWQQEVEAVDPRSRLACARCRQMYDMCKVLALTADTNESGESGKGKGPEDNFLHDELANNDWKREQPTSVFNRNEFYCGMSFDSRLARTCNFHKVHAVIGLQAKLHVERARHIVKHGSEEGYKQRFVFDTRIGKVFEKASKLVFAAPSRSPMGLNPERFMAKCEACDNWLANYEYSVKFCELCAIQKLP